MLVKDNPSAMYNPSALVCSAAPNEWSKGFGAMWPNQFKPPERKEQGEGYQVYLSNIPENARLPHVMGSLRKLLGAFRAVNLVRLVYGSCKVIFEKKENRDKLLTNTFDVFGTPIKATLTPPNPGETWPTVHMHGLPPETTVKQLLGAIKKQIGQFQATNKLSIVNGYSKIVFKDETMQRSLLANGLSICSKPICLSKSLPGVGAKRGLGQLVPQHIDQFVKRRRLGFGFSGFGMDGRHGVGFGAAGLGLVSGTGLSGGLAAGPCGSIISKPEFPATNHPVVPRTVEALRMDNSRLSLRVRYLEEQVAMFEQFFATRIRGQTTIAASAYNNSLW